MLCGPILLDAPSVESVDAELAAWLKGRPTVLICLGSHIALDDAFATEIIAGLRTLFDTRKDVQVLWKLSRQGLPERLDDKVVAPVKEEVEEGRLRMVTWLKPDPLAILETGNVVCVVNHGGSNSYHEAVWYVVRPLMSTRELTAYRMRRRTGVPQIVLPAWFDCYDFAARAEYLGIGLWANRNSAPRVSGAELGDALLTILGSGGEGNDGFARKAEELSEKVRRYGGRAKAAELLLEWATKKAV